MNIIVNHIKIRSEILPVYDILPIVPIIRKNIAIKPGIVNPETQRAQKKYIREKKRRGQTLAHTIHKRKQKVPNSAMMWIYGENTGKIASTRLLII